MKFKFIKAALSGLIILTCNMANATLIEFTDGTKTDLNGNICTSSSCDNIETYEEDGYLFTFSGSSSSSTYIDAFIGNYDGSGEDVVHGHYSHLSEIRITSVDGSAFNLIDFQLTTLTSLHWNLNALSNGTDISHSFLLPTEDWGAAYGANPVLTMGAEFHNIMAASITALPGAFGIGFDNFNMTPTSVPEPSTLAIFALGMIGLVSRRFKKQF